MKSEDDKFFNDKYFEDNESDDEGYFEDVDNYPEKKLKKSLLSLQAAAADATAIQNNIDFGKVGSYRGDKESLYNFNVDSLRSTSKKKPNREDIVNDINRHIENYKIPDDSKITTSTDLKIDLKSFALTLDDEKMTKILTLFYKDKKTSKDIDSIIKRFVEDYNKNNPRKDLQENLQENYVNAYELILVQLFKTYKFDTAAQQKFLNIAYYYVSPDTRPDVEQIVKHYTRLNPVHKPRVQSSRIHNNEALNRFVDRQRFFDNNEVNKPDPDKGEGLPVKRILPKRLVPPPLKREIEVLGGGFRSRKRCKRSKSRKSKRKQSKRKSRR